MFDAALAVTVNHVLAQAPWARERLKPFAGKTAHLSVVPFTYHLSVTADGLVEAATADAEADGTISVTPPVLLRILAGDEAARQQARISGDAAFVQEIAYLAQHLRWDYEEDLSRVVGDVAAHRIGETARNLGGWSRHAAQSLAENLRDYWVQEQPLIADRGAVERFVAEVDRLRDDVERLEKRIDRLSRGGA